MKHGSIVFIVSLFGLLFLLNGCASIHSTSGLGADVKTDKKAEFGYKKNMDCAYYVKVNTEGLEGDSNATIGKTIEISSKRQELGNISPSSDVLCVNKGLTFVGPVFDSQAVKTDWGTFVCPFFGSDNATSNSPCVSNLTRRSYIQSVYKNPLSFRRFSTDYFGERRVLDREKGRKLISETDVLNRVWYYKERVQDARKRASQYLDKIQIRPSLRDRSGYLELSGSKLYTSHKEKIGRIESPEDLENVRYVLFVNPAQDTAYEVEASKKREVVSYSRAKYEWNPKILVKSRKFDFLAVNAIASNDVLTMSISKLRKHQKFGNVIYLPLRLANTSIKERVKVKDVSVWINDHRLEFRGGNRIIPSGEARSIVVRSFVEDDNDLLQLIEDIRSGIAKKDASEMAFRLKLNVKYRLGDEKKYRFEVTMKDNVDNLLPLDN